jgi:hypothetical protein
MSFCQKLDTMASSILPSAICRIIIFTALLLGRIAPSLAQGAPDVSPNSHVSIWYPTPQEPDGTLLSINCIDTLLMSYDSEWSNVNASMWCNIQGSDGGGYYAGRQLNNPIAATGNYAIDNLTSKIEPSKYPVTCHFYLMDAKNSSDSFAGGSYLMVSTGGLAVTRSYQVASATTMSEVVPTASSSATVASAEAGTGAVAATAPAITGPPSEDGGSSHLFIGAIVGIVIGVFVGVVVLPVVVLCFIGRKRGWKLTLHRRRKVEGSSGNRSATTSSLGVSHSDICEACGSNTAGEHCRSRPMSEWLRPELRQELSGQSVGRNPFVDGSISS